MRLDTTEGEEAWTADRVCDSPTVADALRGKQKISNKHLTEQKSINVSVCACV